MGLQLSIRREGKAPRTESRRQIDPSPDNTESRSAQAIWNNFGSRVLRNGIQHRGAFIRLLIRSQVLPSIPQSYFCPMGRNQPAGISESCREARLPFYFDAAIWLKLFAGISFLHGNILQSYSFLGVSFHRCCQIRCLLRMAAPGSEI